MAGRENSSWTYVRGMNLSVPLDNTRLTIILISFTVEDLVIVMNFLLPSSLICLRRLDWRTACVEEE